MKRPYAFLLTIALLAAPALAGPGGQGNHRADRAQAKTERQVGAREHRAARQAAAQVRHENRTARRAAAQARQQERGARHAAASSKRQARAAARESVRATSEARRVQHQAAVAQRRAERNAIAAERQGRRQSRMDRVDRREAQHERLADRVRRQQALTLRTQRRAELVREGEIARAERRAVAESRPWFRRQRPFVDRAWAREQRVAARQQRFRGLDFDRDGVISRAEWRGNDRSFMNHDWNRDGILSGVEVVPAGARVTRVERVPLVERFLPLPRRFVAPVQIGVLPVAPGPWDLLPLPPLAEALPLSFDEDRLETVVRTQGFVPVDLVVRRVRMDPLDRVLLDDRFLVLDGNRDTFVTFDEWSGPRPLFRALDVNRDRRLIVNELVVPADPRVQRFSLVDRERYVAFNLIDRDDDGAIAPWEWTGSMDVFFLLDVDSNGVLDANEYLGLVRARPVPVRWIARGDLDCDHNGFVSRSEWVGDPLRFVSLDLNDDGRVKPLEAMVGSLLATV